MVVFLNIDGVTALQLACDDEHRVGVMLNAPLYNVPVNADIPVNVNYAVFFVVNGIMTVEVNGEEIVVSRNEMIFTSPLSDFHIKKMGTDLCVSCFVCCREIFERLLMENGGDAGMLLSKSDFPVVSLSESQRKEFHTMLELIDLTIRNPHHYKEQMVFAYVRALQLFLIEMLYANDGAPSPAAHCDRVYLSFMALAQQHFRKQHKIDFYAKELCISPSYLSRIVKSRSRRTVKEILADMIYSDACRQLRNTDAQLKTISENLGFLSLSAFSHFFKLKSGMPPSEFREQPRSTTTNLIHNS